MFLQFCVAREKFKARLQLGARKTAQAETQTTRRARARFVRIIIVKLLRHGRGQLFERAVGKGKILRLQSFLRPVHAGAALLAEQGILHVHGHYKLIE